MKTINQTKIKAPKKLIEVALPLDDINIAAAREKSIRHGHPSTLHLWWARRPLAAARAVLFAQLVNDPGYERNLQRGMNKEKAQIERERLFGIIRRLVKWENTNNTAVLAEANAEICKSWRETCELNKNHPDAAEIFNPETLPSFHDPFSGGGAIPLEAQRLGLESWGTDLNPVAVLINKSMIEIPPIFAGTSPVGPLMEASQQEKLSQDWTGAKGLAEDVQRYGQWMGQEAVKTIGHLYPQVDLPQSHGGGKATVIAWIWARTVKSPNPAASPVNFQTGSDGNLWNDGHVPLASTFYLNNKAGKEVYIEPVVDRETNTFRFVINYGKPLEPERVKTGTKLSRGANFRCVITDTPIEPSYIKSEGFAGRMGARLMAVIAEGPQGRVYLEPTQEIEAVAHSAKPEWRPSGKVPERLTGGTCYGYGLREWGDLFTNRQLAGLSTFSELIQIVHGRIEADAKLAGWKDDLISLENGGSGAKAYADAVSIYLSYGISKISDRGSTLCRWDPTPTASGIINTFSRQSLPMTWDFAESNFFSHSSGSWEGSLTWITKVLKFSIPAENRGFAAQEDAQNQNISISRIVSTDPPYYDNIGYADLSDFFYVWLRRSLKSILPDLFSTLAVPKAEELIAMPYRHGSRKEAELFFLDGMTQAMNCLATKAHTAFPVSIYYAFKQADTKEGATSSTGWETFLEAVIRSGFVLTGTWPMRTELANRMIGSGTNALASSIVLICRPRLKDSETINRRRFIAELKEMLPDAIQAMIGENTAHSPITPVDLAQAAIGPGMAVFSQYTSVLEADGTPMTVHTALIMINKAIDEYFNETEGELDADTRFCIAWFDEYSWVAGPFGQADVLARAKGTSVDAVRDAGALVSGGGKVQLIKAKDYPPNWDPKLDNRTPVWEALHQMIRALGNGGETEAGVLLAGMPERTLVMKQLAYRLHILCERKGWSEEARGYNELITSWQAIEKASHEAGRYGGQLKLEDFLNFSESN